MGVYNATSGSKAEDLFIDLFCDAFGADKAGYLYSQFPFFDIYGNSRFADFVLDCEGKRIAFEVDDEATHNKAIISYDKFQDDLLRQNSMVYSGFQIFRFPVKQLQKQPYMVQDELKVFLGQHPLFKEIQDYLPKQRGKAIELKGHQKEALASLEEMRSNFETIALLFHATGTGKTTTAVSDAKVVGGRTLFVAHTHELVTQACDTFRELWSEENCGLYVESIKQPNAYIVCGSIQSIALNLDKFKENDFDYLIIDEAHHATADTYQKVLQYFKPKFTLGLTATPERSDNKNLLDIFKNTAHKLDIKTAVEIGELVPVRCIRIHTNVDITNVRFNSVKYNSVELESKIFVPGRNKLIIETWIEYVQNKKTVIFCASVKHANEIANLFIERGVKALAISGTFKSAERKEMLAEYENNDTNILCACDLLNEGWDSPQTEVLFMARPTMSKVLYTQQLGRGMRTCEGKEYLMVFDFVDNSNIFNAPISLHRLFNLKDYKPGKQVLGKQKSYQIDEGLYEKAEKPEALIDYPISVKDYEIVDIFNWQEEAYGMISQMEFTRRVSVQSETIQSYIRDGKLIPDMVVPMSNGKSFKYFHNKTLIKYADEYGWTIINDSNRKVLFMDMCRQMDMSYSYKPVFLKSLLFYSDEKGKINLSDIVTYFREFYNFRSKNNLIVEKNNSIYSKVDYTDKEVERNILMNPFKRFEDMNMMNHSKTLGILQIDMSVWKKLKSEEKEEINKICDEKLKTYYERLEKIKINIKV